MDRKETEFRNHDVARDPGEAASGTRPTTMVTDAAKTSELRRQGEELFSLGSFQEAIHVWTRILFLDRGNLEARQRIDAAKQAIAERQRRLDLMALEASRLLESGDVEAARRTVRSVLSVDPSHPEALAIVGMLSALERRPDSPCGSPAPRADEAAAGARGILLRVPRGKALPAPSRRSVASKVQMAAFLLGASLAFAASALYLFENWDSIVSDGAFARGAVLGPGAGTEPAPPVPDLSELHYYNGVRLFQQERYREALAELGRVDGASPFIADARRLTVRIEERLLRGSVDREPTSTPAAPGAVR